LGSTAVQGVRGRLFPPAASSYIRLHRSGEVQ
jgi:hypothetical protein